MTAERSEYVVVLIDDNELNLKLVRDVLRFHGFTTHEASSAAGGIDLVRSVRPDAVLMDIQLPDSDGVDALNRLRSDPATAAVPVMALTAFAMKGDRERLLAAGFDAYVSKPIDSRAIAGEVEACCRRHRTRTP